MPAVIRTNIFDVLRIDNCDQDPNAWQDYSGLSVRETDDAKRFVLPQELPGQALHWRWTVLVNEQTVAKGIVRTKALAKSNADAWGVPTSWDRQHCNDCGGTCCKGHNNCETCDHCVNGCEG